VVPAQVSSGGCGPAHPASQSVNQTEMRRVSGK
jgi:hypothetical protein